MDDRTVPGLPPFPSHLVLPPEFRLAVACSWIAPESRASLQNEMVAANFKAGVDWDAFLALVDRHGIPVQALSVLRRCLGAELPERLCRALKARSKRTKVRSFVQTCELIRLNRLLCEHGIDMMPLKGVALSQRLYGSPDVRASGDIDVLIRPEDLAAVDRLLEGIGYRKVYDLTERQMLAFQDSFHHVNYVNRELGQHLELHWRSRFWSPEDLEGLWQSRQTVALADESFNIPEDASLFLFLCDHGARHRWVRLKWLGDIAMMLTDDAMHHLSAAPGLADRMGLHRVVAQTALLAHWLYELPLPRPIVERVVKEAAAVRLAQKALAAMLGELEVHKSLGTALRFEGLRNAMYYKQIRPALSRSRLLRGLATCPIDYVLFPLPDRWFWMYVPLRPVFWLWRHFGGRLFPGFGSKYGAE